MTNPEDREVLQAQAQPEPGTGLPAAAPAPPGTASAAPAQPGPVAPVPGPAAAKITPGDLVLGGPALASDIIGSWLQQKAPTAEQALAQPATPRSVLLPEAEWEAAFGPLHRGRARYAAIGAAIDAGAQVRRTGSRLVQAGDAAVAWALRPLRRSRLLAPVRRRFNRLVAVGDAQVERWAAVGRGQEARSRALTRATFEQLVSDSTDLVAGEPHVQLIVQEIVTSQGMGMAEEALLEVRERAVTLDMVLEKPVRRWLRRVPRTALPAPESAIYVPPNPRDRARHPHAPDFAGQYAGFASRLLAFVVDVLIILTAFSLTGLLVRDIQAIFNFGALLRAIFGASAAVGWEPVATGLIAMIATVVYWVAGWALTGKSLGDMVMGVRVVGRTGRYPSLGQACIRIVGYLLAILSLGIGFLWILVNDHRQGWHDRLAGTVVLYDWHARPDETFLIGSVQEP